MRRPGVALRQRDKEFGGRVGYRRAHDLRPIHSSGLQLPAYFHSPAGLRHIGTRQAGGGWEELHVGSPVRGLVV
jgi:hypothetical protein